MRNPNGCRVVLLAIPPLFLLFPVSVITFALERISDDLILAQTQRDSRSGGYNITVYGPTRTGSNDSTYTEINFDINEAPTIAILGICILVYIVSAIDVLGIWELRKVEGTQRHQRRWSWVMFISNVVMAGASAGILGYASAVQSSENKWQRYEDVGKDDQIFTRETWACQIHDFFPDQGWAGAACSTAKATRLLLIPMAVSSALVLVSLWILVRDRGGLKWLIGGKGRYGGFENVYELRPTNPGAPRIVQPQQQWVPQPVQQRPPHAVHQSPQQPSQSGSQQPVNQA